MNGWMDELMNGLMDDRLLKNNIWMERMMNEWKNRMMGAVLPTIFNGK